MSVAQSTIAMETDDPDDFSETPQSFNSLEGNVDLKKGSTKRYRPSPKRLLPPLRPIDFDKYVKENCKEKVKILHRATFHQIKKPIIIFFNHFREKCAYHTKCLDKLFQLSLKYGDRIEFIAADMLDIDIMNSKWHSIDLFCRIGNPEKVSALIYAIDEQKRIREHFSAEKDHESLTTLCENLLKGSLFITEPLPESNNRSLVKVCVHQNYRQLVNNSSKHVLLIVDLEDWLETSNDNAHNFEGVAEQLKPYNVDVVYINAEKNYIPFELGISCYPSIFLLACDGNTKSVEPIVGPGTQENIIHFVKSYLKDSKSFLDKKELELRKNIYQPLNVFPDFKLHFMHLHQYLQENCHHYLKVFERQAFQRSNRFIIIAFMSFEDEQCSAHHLKWIDKIYQVAINLSSPREYFIADFKDIDVINPLWNPLDFRKHYQSECLTPKVFGIDLNKNKFVLKDFKNAASLFYFAYSLTNGELYISEPWPNKNEEKLVKTCIADSLNLSITSMKKDIFLAIYYSGVENYEEFLQLLEDIARYFEKLALKVMKIDSRFNCIPLELDNSMYPIMYFIPQADKSKRVYYSGDNLCKENILEFIKQNVKANKSLCQL